MLNKIIKIKDIKWRKIFGSKIIFLLSLLPSLILFINDYVDYYTRKGIKSCGRSGWGYTEYCRNFFHYLDKGTFVGLEFILIAHLIIIFGSLLFLGSIYFLSYKKYKFSFLFFSLLLVLIIWIFNF